MAEDGFLSRWSRRKLETGRAEVPAVEPPPVEPVPAEAALPASPPLPEPPPAEPSPTLEDVQALTPEADFSRFVRPEVDAGVQRAALKKLFADPHFNVMDGLDVYIDDYHTPDPLPASMLRQMVQSRLLGLFEETPEKPADEDPDLRLQPDDAAGRAEPEPGPVADPGGEP